MLPPRHALLTACCTLLLAVPTAAAIYRWVDDAGRIHFGDRPPPAKTATPLDLPEADTPLLDKIISPATTDLPLADDAAQAASPAALPASAIPWPESPPCDFALSAFLDRQTEGFTPIVPTELTEPDQQGLQSLLQAMSGRWRGAISEVTCLGGSADATAKSVYYYIVANGDWDKRRARWSLLSEGDASRGATDKVFAHYLEPGPFLYYYDFTGYDAPVERQANDLAVAGNRVELLPAGPDAFAFHIKRRVGNIGAVELRRFQLLDESLEISELFFTAGTLSGYRQWRLER